MQIHINAANDIDQRPAQHDNSENAAEGAETAVLAQICVHQPPAAEQPNQHPAVQQTAGRPTHHAPPDPFNKAEVQKHPAQVPAAAKIKSAGNSGSATDARAFQRQKTPPNISSYLLIDISKYPAISFYPSI